VAILEFVALVVFSGGLLLLRFAAIIFIVSAAGADLVLRAFEGDRPKGDEPPVESPGAEAGPTR